MAKKRKPKGEVRAGASGGSKRAATMSGPLAPAIEMFSRGDYVSARRLFDEVLAPSEPSEQSEENRQMAKTLRGSLGLDLGTLYVGIACIGLYLLVILVAILKQP